LIKLSGKKKAEEVRRWYDDKPDYKKAWDIVEKEGSRKIIRERIK
jgi:hypothetical protein